MSKRSLKQKEALPYKEFVDSLPALGVVIGIILIIVCLILAGMLMQAPVAQAHDVGLF